MIGITSAEEIAAFEPMKKVIGVFVATRYDQSAIEWLQSDWFKHQGDGDAFRHENNFA